MNTVCAVPETINRECHTTLAVNTINRPVDILLGWRDDGSLELDAPYQREEVWGLERQINLIRSMRLGIPLPTVMLNDREWVDDDRTAVVDGKQRLTTIFKFLDGELAIPGEWYSLTGDVTFKDLARGTRRRFLNQAIATSEASFRSVEEEWEVFNLLNFGGVTQGQSDFTDN